MRSFLSSPIHPPTLLFLLYPIIKYSFVSFSTFNPNGPLLSHHRLPLLLLLPSLFCNGYLFKLKLFIFYNITAAASVPSPGPVPLLCTLGHPLVFVFNFECSKMLFSRMAIRLQSCHGGHKFTPWLIFHCLCARPLFTTSASPTLTLYVQFWCYSSPCLCIVLLHIVRLYSETHTEGRVSKIQLWGVRLLDKGKFRAIKLWKEQHGHRKDKQMPTRTTQQPSEPCDFILLH